MVYGPLTMDLVGPKVRESPKVRKIGERWDCAIPLLRALTYKSTPNTTR